MLHNMKNEDVKSFIMAGNAIVTLESENTGARYTYRIKAPKDGSVRFVQLLTGPDNTSAYQYIGFFTTRDVQFKTSTKSQLPVSSTPCKAIDFFLRHIDNIPSKLHVYHSGRCGRCGRLLTTPESIVRGIGPECAKYSN